MTSLQRHACWWVGCALCLAAMVMRNTAMAMVGLAIVLGTRR